MIELRSALIKLHWLLSSVLGFDPLRLLRSLRGLPAFIGDWRRFKRGYDGSLALMPCLHDRYEEGGNTKSEYFWQDLLVARWIHDAQPVKHVDVGSRIDGFVAHVASFRTIEVMDVRPITTAIPGVIFKQVDLMQGPGDAVTSGGGEAADSGNGYCDSLSCPHALEHFGLGRYGDPIDPEGHLKGFANMVALLKPGGTFYLSVPIGRERVEFNANRVFDPSTIADVGRENGLILRALIVIGSRGDVREFGIDENAVRVLAASNYNLGIFTFTKP